MLAGVVPLEVEPEVLLIVVLIGGLAPLHLLPELLLLNLGPGHGPEIQGIAVAGSAGIRCRLPVVVVDVVAHVQPVRQAGQVGTHLRLHLLVGQEGLAGVGVQNVKGDGLALAAAAIVHLLQYPHQQHRAVAALKGIGIAEGAVGLALDDAAAGQLGHRLLADAVHPPPVRQGCGINGLIPEGGGIFLRQGVAEQQGGILAGDRPGQRGLVQPLQQAGAPGGIQPRLIPGRAGSGAAGIFLRGKGPGGHGQELGPGQGCGGAHGVGSGALEDAVARGLRHGDIGPVTGGQVGEGCGRCPRGGGHGQGQQARQDQCADSLYRVHALSLLYKQRIPRPGRSTCFPPYRTR